MRLLFCALLLAVTIASCVSDTDAKLGAQGEFCTSDSDCRIEFLCQCRLCQPLDIEPGTCVLGDEGGDDDDDFILENNDSNNDGDNNVDVVDDLESLCEQLCERLDACFGDSLDDSCPQDCASDSEGFEEDIACLLTLSCEEFINGEDGRCFDDFPEPDEEEEEEEEEFEEEDYIECLDTCERISKCDELVERCGIRQAQALFEACNEACGDPAANAQIRAASELPCEVVTDLAIDGFGLMCR